MILTRDMRVKRAWQTCIQEAEHMPMVKSVSPFTDSSPSGSLTEARPGVY